MDIFIDESGAFLPAPPAKPRLCAVTAVTIRSQLVPQLGHRLGELRASWDVARDEIKGSALNERQMAEALRAFDTYDMTAFAAVVDTGLHPPELIQAYRREGEESLLRGLTPRHNANARRFVGDLIASLRSLSDQLALQVYTTMVPVERVIREMPTYYALRSPSEMATFNWTLDAKSDKGITKAESFWRQLVCPHMQATFIEDSSMDVEGLDYSVYEKSFCSTYTELPDYLRVRLPRRREPMKGKVSDLGKLMLGSLRFEQSHASAGLQAADIIASALTRALNGSLGAAGWRDLGRLFIMRGRKAPLDCIQLALRNDQSKLVVAENVTRVFRTLEGQAKSMWPPGYQQNRKRPR